MILCFFISADLPCQVHRHACQDLSRDQPREFAHVFSTIELLEKKQQHISGGG